MVHTRLYTLHRNLNLKLHFLPPISLIQSVIPSLLLDFYYYMKVDFCSTRSTPSTPLLVIYAPLLFHLDENFPRLPFLLPYKTRDFLNPTSSYLHSLSFPLLELNLFHMFLLFYYNP